MLKQTNAIKHVEHAVCKDAMGAGAWSNGSIKVESFSLSCTPLNYRSLVDVAFVFLNRGFVSPKVSALRKRDMKAKRHNEQGVGLFLQ
jgi:hypothetical protein